MSKAITNRDSTHEFTQAQLELITRTVARDATPDELKLFLYRCKNMGLDPLKPGSVHFIKYGNNPGTMVIGIDGFRSRAAATGKHSGTKRGVIRDDKGKCIGAWCEIYRSDWTQPAREEVSIAEYSTGKSMWAKMPETMIKKVAEVAALRMAFADDLGGMYSDDEMEQADPHHKATTLPATEVKKTEAKVVEAEVASAPPQKSTAKAIQICNCGNRMMISLYPDKRDPGATVLPWFCVKCRTFKARTTNEEEIPF